MNTPRKLSLLPRLAIAAAGALVALAAFASAASACSYPDAEKVFAAWQDEGYYQLAPEGGAEEGGTGWTLEGGAEIVEGNESYYLNSSEDSAALSIPYGGTAISPPVCVDEDTPVFRLMALNSGDQHSILKVSVTYIAEDRTRQSNVRIGDEWEPTKALKLDTNKGERAARISFTPKDEKGDWLIDDLYVDPWARR